MEEEDKGRIKETCRCASDKTCSYFQALSVIIYSERRLGVLARCVCESHSKCKKVLTNSILAFEESGLHQVMFPAGRFYSVL